MPFSKAESRKKTLKDQGLSIGTKFLKWQRIRLEIRKLLIQLQCNIALLSRIQETEIISAWTTMQYPIVMTSRFQVALQKLKLYRKRARLVLAGGCHVLPSLKKNR